MNRKEVRTPRMDALVKEGIEMVSVLERSRSLHIVRFARRAADEQALPFRLGHILSSSAVLHDYSVSTISAQTVCLR